MTQTNPQTILALDVGTKRVGVAVASLVARLPRPVTTLQAGEGLLAAIAQIAKEESAAAIVVGLPRGMQGQRTAQTELTEQFIAALHQHVQLPIYLQDEALTSHKAEMELSGRGKNFSKGDVDALAATYILEDYLQDLKSEDLHG